MSEESPLTGKKILIVDDEPDILAVLEELLSVCNVSRAETFNTAKELLESQDFDIAVLDIMGVDGYKLLEIANQRDIPAVMLTAHALSPNHVVKSIKEGAASYIPKDEITHIADFLVDVFKAKAEGRNPWGPWQDRLPSSYFERRWGAVWKDQDKEFWKKFRAGLKARRSKSK